MTTSWAGWMRGRLRRLRRASTSPGGWWVGGWVGGAHAGSASLTVRDDFNCLLLPPLPPLFQPPFPVSARSANPTTHSSLLHPPPIHHPSLMPSAGTVIGSPCSRRASPAPSTAWPPRAAPTGAAPLVTCWPCDGGRELLFFLCFFSNTAPCCPLAAAVLPCCTPARLALCSLTAAPPLAGAAPCGQGRTA